MAEARVALELDGVSAGYGETVVIEDVRLTLAEGERLSVIGRNGVGKSTLLGTVMGLIRAFAAVATINPAEKANLLSASISVAMNCTAFGLMTAVPLLFVHAFLQTKTTELIDSLEMASVKFLNAITERQQPPAAAA